MAWQSPSAMNAGGQHGGGDGSVPAGTEYTLQGTAPPVDTMHMVHVMHSMPSTLTMPTMHTVHTILAKEHGLTMAQA